MPALSRSGQEEVHNIMCTFLSVVYDPDGAKVVSKHCRAGIDPEIERKVIGRKQVDREKRKKKERGKDGINKIDREEARQKKKREKVA